MAGIRALQKRLGKLEDAGKPKPSPFTVLFASFDAWVERDVPPGLESGALSEDFIGVVASLRVGKRSIADASKPSNQD